MSGETSRAQLTIVYDGTVNVHEDVPADKVNAINLLLSNGTISGGSCNELRQVNINGCHVITTPNPCLDQTSLINMLNNTDQPTAITNTFNSVDGDGVQCRSSTSPCPSPQVELKKKQQPPPKLPFARTTPVSRRLAMRKDRVEAIKSKESPVAVIKDYPGSPACKKINDHECVAQVHEIVQSGRLPADLSEMDRPLMVKELRSYFRNTKPTPTCPRSPCLNPGNTAFRSLNIGKDLCLKAIFDCKSCEHRLTLNGRLRAAPVRPRPDSGNRQAAPDHSSPPSFSSMPWAEQQLQAAGQITTHGLPLLHQQQRQGADSKQDLTLNYGMERKQQLLLQDHDLAEFLQWLESIAFYSCGPEEDHLQLPPSSSPTLP